MGLDIHRKRNNLSSGVNSSTVYVVFVLVATAEEQVTGSSVVVRVDLSSSIFDLLKRVNSAQ